MIGKTGHIAMKMQKGSPNGKATHMSLTKERSLEDEQADLIVKYQRQILEMEQAIEYNREVLMDANDGVVKVDNNQKIIFCNKAAASLLGYKPVDLLGGDVNKLIPQKDLVKKRLFKSAQSKGPDQTVKSSHDLEASKKDGSKIRVEFSVVGKFNGKYFEHTVFIKEIINQPETIATDTELYQEVDNRINQINVACVVCELDLKGKITYVNDLWCEVSQYSREECIGQHYSMFRHSDTPTSLFKELNETMEAGKTFRSVVKNGKKDGSAYWVDAVIAPILDVNGGAPLKYIGVQYVISDLVERQEELNRLNEEQANNLAKLSRLMDEKEVQTRLFDKVNAQMEKFLYSTSHDLRSPITTILGLINLMRVDVKDKVVGDYISKIETSANKLDRTIKDIMAYSISAYQHIDSERIDFEPLVWGVWNSHSEEMAFQKIRIDVQVKGESIFYSDTKRLKTIFKKLIENAIHFHDVNKATPFIRIIIVVESDQIHLEIADNGVGIGESYLNDIFTMFFKASHLSKGAGLGLFLVKEATSQLRGKIKVESEIGFGSVFRITIPNSHKGKLIHRKMLLMQTNSIDN